MAPIAFTGARLIRFCRDNSVLPDANNMIDAQAAPGASATFNNSGNADPAGTPRSRFVLCEARSGLGPVLRVCRRGRVSLGFMLDDALGFSTVFVIGNVDPAALNTLVAGDVTLQQAPPGTIAEQAVWLEAQLQ